MRLADDAVVRDSYDVVVIGSGLSSLTAAALLARRGLSTLVLEHHYLPGGMCTTLRRKGFSFDTGTALMYGFGERGFNPHRWLMNELEEEVDIIEHRALLRMRFEDRQLTFWPDLDRFLDEICAAFPNQEKELRALYSYLRHLYTDVIAREPVIVPPTEMPASHNLKTLLRHPVALLTALRMMRTSTADVLTRYITDPELLAFFDKLTSTYVYCTIEETPAILAATMFVDNHIGGAYYPARSPQVLTSKLEKAVEKCGGQALYGRTVDEIVIEQGAATGVRLSDGSFIRAGTTVAGVTVWNLYSRLIRPEHSRPKRRAWAESLVPTYASNVLYIGVDAEAIPDGTLPVEMLIADKRGVNEGDLTLYISSLDDPSICPAGTHAVTAISPSFDKWPRPWDPEYRSLEYRNQKQTAAERVLDQIERHFPGFRRHILVLEVGTPATIERYTLKNRGAVGGPKQCIGQELMKRLHTTSEWRNLYLCGDSTVMGMGTPAVTASGVGAANRVLRSLGKAEYRVRGFEHQYVRITKGRPLSPLPDSSERIDQERAARLARECEYCEHPGCSRACPARIDVRNVMRRIEAGNFAGAARLMREVNPLAEVCSYLCKPDPPCELRCNRRAFSDHPVRIADLLAWVGAQAGEQGWNRWNAVKTGKLVAVVGAGPAGLTCACFLARLGHEVELFDRHEQTGNSIREAAESILPPDVAAREIAGILDSGVRFTGQTECLSQQELHGIAARFDAVFIATGAGSRQAVTDGLGIESLDVKDDGSFNTGVGNCFAGGALLSGPCSAVRAVADGRRAAAAIDTSLRPDRT